MSPKSMKKSKWNLIPFKENCVGLKRFDGPNLAWIYNFLHIRAYLHGSH